MKKDTKRKKAVKKTLAACGSAAGDFRNCPIFITLGLIGSKWSIALLSQMLSAPEYTIRFNALRKLVVGISQGELTKHLRLFEESGIVVRTIYPEVPPRVEYTLTPLGISLYEPIKALCAWAVKHGEHITATRAAYHADQR